MNLQVAALRAISNLVIDFTMHKSLFVQNGGVKQLVELSKSMDSRVRLNAVWALRNLMFLVDSRCKEGILLELRAMSLTSLVSGNPFVTLGMENELVKWLGNRSKWVNYLIQQ